MDVYVERHNHLCIYFIHFLQTTLKHIKIVKQDVYIIWKFSSEKQQCHTNVSIYI